MTKTLAAMLDDRSSKGFFNYFFDSLFMAVLTSVANDLLWSGLARISSNSAYCNRLLHKRDCSLSVISSYLLTGSEVLTTRSRFEIFL